MDTRDVYPFRAMAYLGRSHAPGARGHALRDVADNRYCKH
jgi:hypothetical protein